MTAPEPVGTPLAAAWPASIWWATAIAALIGTAKAWVAWDCPPWNWNPEPLEPDPAVSMPITWPVLLTSGPPESPGWMGALCRMSPVRCSTVPAPSSEALMAAPRPATWPTATDGVPPLPSALPRATTLSPTLTVDESPSDTVCSPDAPTSWSTAMSLLWSYPTTLAG